MKKFLKLIVISLCLIFVVVGFTACPGEDEFQGLRDALENTKSCTQINQTIIIKGVSNDVTMYKQVKQYVKDGDGYAVDISERKLNTLDKEDPWQEDQSSDYVSRADHFVASIVFDKEYYKTNTDPQGAKFFNANIKDECFDTVFGISAEHSAINNIVLTITLDNDGVSNVTVTFTYKSQEFGSYFVEIIIEYYY